MKRSYGEITRQWTTADERTTPMKKLLLMVAVLAIASAGAALAGSCTQYCGVFAGFHWCNTTCR
jgi:hypothetical protein